MDLLVCRISNNAVLLYNKFPSSRLPGGARRVMNTWNRPSNDKSKLFSSSSAKKKAHSSSSSMSKQQQHGLHSSASSNQSTAALGHVPHSSTGTTAFASIPRPSGAELRTLFVASAIPMVGFGFMDNLVMIQAGQYIDSTIGVTMGLATLSAAAAGQVVSDVSGVVFGGTLERFLERVGLVKKITLSAAQRGLPICRNVAMAGAVIGVIIGCTLGATSLMFIDLEKRDRIQRVTQLREIVSDMIMDHVNANNDHVVTARSNLGNCHVCTLHLASLSKHDFDIATTTQHGSEDSSCNSKTRIDFLNDTDLDSIAAQSAEQRESMISDDSRTLCVPVVSNQNDQVIAVLEFTSNKSTEQVESSTMNNDFTAEDERSAKTMARHIAIFMDRMTA